MSCNPTTPEESTPETKLSIKFLASDNSTLTDDIIGTPLSVSATSNYYTFYIDKTSTELTSLSLTMQTETSGGSDTFSFAPNPVGTAIDYATPQTFAVTRTVNGVAQEPVNITVALFRKPVATASSEVANDVITIDYEIKSDALNDAVFAMYPSSITVTNPAHILNANIKLRRNLAGLSTDEYLVMDRAGSVLGGATGDDEAMLSPSTSYKLYFAYPFANGTKLLTLDTRSTVAATQLGATTMHHTMSMKAGSTDTTGKYVHIRPTEELFKFAVIINNFDATASAEFFNDDVLLISDGVISSAATGKYRERIEAITGTTYTVIILDNKPMTAANKASLTIGVVTYNYRFGQIKSTFVTDNP